VKGWQLVEFGRPLQLMEREDPRPEAGEVVLDVKGAGLCRSDVAEMAAYGSDSFLGKYIGHELGGVVSAVGAGVAQWKVGDRVAVCPSAPSESIPGYFRDGGFATKHVAPAGDLVAIPDEVGFALGAMMTDAGMTPYHALMTNGGLTSGMKVGIIGLGGLGQIGARLAALKGAEVHVAEPKRDVWRLAERAGVSHLVADAADWEDQGFDLILDCAGFGTTTVAAIRAIRKYGTVVLVGQGVKEAVICLDELWRRHCRLIGSRGGTKQDIADLYELILAGDLVPEFTEIGFDDIPQGLADLAAGKVTGRLVALL
jgi:alcohol dehydrogenase, propanol-preferring